MYLTVKHICNLTEFRKAKILCYTVRSISFPTSSFAKQTAEPGYQAFLRVEKVPEIYELRVRKLSMNLSVTKKGWLFEKCLRIFQRPKWTFLMRQKSFYTNMISQKNNKISLLWKHIANPFDIIGMGLIRVHRKCS